MLLAYKILQNTAPEIFEQIILPRSYFIGADVFYDFLALNNVEFLDQKYKSAEQIRAEYPEIQETICPRPLPGRRSPTSCAKSCAKWAKHL